MSEGIFGQVWDVWRDPYRSQIPSSSLMNTTCPSLLPSDKYAAISAVPVLTITNAYQVTKRLDIALFIQFSFHYLERPKPGAST